MIGYKLTQQDCGSLNREYACVYYRAGETFEAPGRGAHLGMTLNGVMCGGYGPRLIAIEWDVADELDRDDGVVQVQRGRVLARLPEDAPAWTQAWEGEPLQAEAIRRLLSLGGEENWRCVAEWAARGSAEESEALRRLLSLGGEENLRFVAMYAAYGSAERAKAIRLLE
jgi:hypothetical protein